MELRALVVDDEQLAREELSYLLEQVDGVTIVGAAKNGVEALGMIEDLDPDLVFLDVQMPGLTGFEVARQALAKGFDTELVFVTAYDQHAIEAFEINAVDYLLKPVDVGRLDQAVQRAQRRIAGERPVAVNGHVGTLKNEEVERIVQLVTERQQRRDRLAVKVGDRFVLIQADEVVFASLADDGITIVANHLAGTSNYRTLDELQAQLDPNLFWRVHRAHLVNINKIKEIVPWFSRNYILRMRDPKATEIPVSRSQTKRLREYLRL
jgi:two-component system LytT family response regulator/two-component system response regulator LytT